MYMYRRTSKPKQILNNTFWQTLYEYIRFKEKSPRLLIRLLWVGSMNMSHPKIDNFLYVCQITLIFGMTVHNRPIKPQVGSYISGL